MVPFSQQQVPPAVKSHLDSQFSFLVDMSKRMFDGVQRINQLNVQVAQRVMEESLNSSHKLIEADTPADFLSAAVSQFQPLPETIRTYQQNLSNIAANVQVDISKTAEEHVPQTTRTAAAVAEELVRRGTEESQKATQRQREALDKMSRTQEEITQSLQQNGHAQAQGQSQSQPQSQSQSQSQSQPQTGKQAGAGKGA